MVTGNVAERGGSAGQLGGMRSTCPVRAGSPWTAVCQPEKEGSRGGGREEGQEKKGDQEGGGGRREWGGYREEERMKMVMYKRRKKGQELSDSAIKIMLYMYFVIVLYIL